MKQWFLGAVAVLALLVLWALSQWSPGLDTAVEPGASRVQATTDGGLFEVEVLTSAEDREKGRTTLDRKADESGGDNGEGKSTGELRFLSEKQFRQRLLELGGGDPRRIFDRLHQQQPDKGNIWVLVTDGDRSVVEQASVFLDPPQAQQPVAGSLTGNHPKDGLKETTGSDGLAVFMNVAPRSYLLAVQHGDYLTGHQAQVESKVGEKTYIEVVLQQAQERIEGIVVDQNSAAVWGANVSTWRYTEGGLTFARSVSTDLDGRFSLGVIPGSQSRVLATKLGYKDARLQHVAAGTKALTLRLESSETVWVSGFVTRGSTREPIVQFTVGAEAVYDQGGRFRVERNVMPEPQALLFAAQGYESRSMVVTLDSNIDLDMGQVSLFGDGELSGVVLIEQEEGDPQPVGGALVSVTAAEDFSDSQVTGPDGLFSFRGLRASSARLVASAAGAGQYQNEVALVEGDVTYVEVLLPQGQYQVSGHVLEVGSDEPIEGAQVFLVGRPEVSTLTDAAGAYELRNIPSAQFTLQASHSGYNDETSPVISGDAQGSNWVAHLTPSGLRFQFQAHGVHVQAGVPVVLWKRIDASLAAALTAQQNLGALRMEEVTDGEGRVTFDVEDGDYFVQVPSYRLDPTLVQASSGQADWNVMALPGITRLRGRISNSDGTPVANTSLWLHSGDQDYSTMSLYYTDAGGNYAIENLAPKPYALSIIKSVADQSAQQVVEVSGNGSPEQVFDVTFPPLTAAVHGRLTDGNGAGLSGVWIGVEALDAPHRSILAGWVGTDATGHFQVPRLGPGRHILRTAWGSFQNVFSDEFTLAVGEDLQLDLVAPQIAGQHIQGHMFASDGGPLGPNFVFVSDPDGHQNGNFFSTMDWGYVGSFDVTGLGPGSHQLRVTAMGCRQKQVPVSVSGSVSGVTVSMQRE